MYRGDSLDTITEENESINSTSDHRMNLSLDGGASTKSDYFPSVNFQDSEFAKSAPYLGAPSFPLYFNTKNQRPNIDSDLTTLPLPSNNYGLLLVLITLGAVLSLHILETLSSHYSFSELSDLDLSVPHQKTFFTDEGLVFDSDFDSGNLIFVKYGKHRHYYLGIGQDCCEDGDMKSEDRGQEAEEGDGESNDIDWFHFSVHNVTNPGLYKFSIVN